MVNEFRQLLRSELRTLVTRDALPPGTAARLKEQLDAVRAGPAGAEATLDASARSRRKAGEFRHSS